MSIKKLLLKQIPLTENDFLNVPTVVSRPDKVSYGSKNKRNMDAIVYAKAIDDDTVLVVEEVRTGKKHLALTTMYKRKRTSTATKTKSNSLDSYVLNDTLSNQRVIENPKPRNILEADKPQSDNPQYKLIRDAVDRATGKHKDKVNLISRADFARVLANRGKSADYIKTNNDTVNAYFDTASKEINVVYNKSNMTPELAAFAAWHELGHYGFRLPRSQEYKVVIDSASKHPLIKELSKKMRDNYANDNVILSDEKAIEEAIVEIFAASQTGDFDHLANQWNLNISPELRGNKDTVFNRIINKIKEIISTVLGRKLSDKELLNILSSLRHDLDTVEVTDSADEVTNEDIRYSLDSGKISIREIEEKSNSKGKATKAQIRERLEKFADSKPIRLTGNEIPYDGNKEKFKRNALEYGKSLRGKYVNKDTGKEVELVYRGIQEVLQHDLDNVDHIESVAGVPYFIKNGIYLDTFVNENLDKKHIIDFDYYLSSIELGDKEYIVKSVVANVKGGNNYYDHKLTEMEKGEFLSQAYQITHRGRRYKNSPLFDTDDKRLLQILQVPNYEGFHYSKGNTELSRESQEQLAKIKSLGSSYEQQSYISQNNLTPEVFDILADDEEWYVRKAVARNPNTSKETLEKLVNGNDSDVKKAVAENPNIPLEMLKKLVNDKHPDVRLQVARNNKIPSEYFRDDVKLSLRAIRFGRQDKELAEHILKELQKDPENNYESLNTLMKSGLIDVSTLKEASIKTVVHKRKELMNATKAIEAGVFRFEDVFKASKIANKDRFIGDLNQTFGKEVVDKWRAKNLIEPETWLSGMDSSPYMMTKPLKRESTIQTIAGHDYAISFFHEGEADIPRMKDLYKTQVASGHPSGFGFVLFRDFDDNGDKSAVITEVQSDIMSVLYSGDKQESAKQIFGDNLDEVKKRLKPEQKTYHRVFARNTMRQLFNSGYKKVYALTPDGIKKLGARPPESVVKEWHSDFDFTNKTTVKIDNKKVPVSAPIEVDSDFAQGVLFSKSPNKDRNYQRVIRNTSDSINANDDAQFSKDSVNDIRERPKAEYKPNLILKAKEIDYKTAKDTIKYVFAGGDTVQPEWAEKFTTAFFDSKAPFSNLLKTFKDEKTQNLERVYRTYEAAASQETSEMQKRFYEPLQEKLQSLWKKEYKELYRDNGGWRQFLEDFSTVGNLIMHGRERNAEILRKTKGKDKAGSGATDEEIKAWEAEIREVAPGLIEHYKDIYATLIKPILEYKDNLLLEAGLLTQEMIEARPKYDYYVPLYGDPAEQESFNLEEPVRLRDIKDKNAKGRSGTFADNIIQNILTSTQNAINRSGQQEFKRELFKVVENNDGLRQIIGGELNTRDIKEAYKKVIGKDGYVYFVPDDTVFTDKKVNSKDRFFADKNAIVLRDGKEVKILRIGNKKIAESLQHVNKQEMNLFLSMLSRGTKTVGRLFTMYNPVFGLNNKIRDVQSQISLVFADKNIPIGKAVGISRKALINSFKFIADINNNPNSKYQIRKREYEKLGGTTYFSHLFGSNQMDSIADEFARGVRASTKHNIAKLGKVINTFLEDYNNHLEMTTRVAMYDAIVESGVMSKEDATLWVKNTMNFETKGKYGDELAALYYFAKPQLFESRRVLQAIRSPRGWITLTTLIALNMFVQEMLISLGGEDDDGMYRYFKIPQTITGNFLTFLSDGDGNGFRIPVGFGLLRIASNTADSLLRYHYGVEDGATTLANIGKNAFLSNLSPVQPVEIDPTEDFASWIVQTFTPSLVKPVIQIATNTNGLGVNIHKPDEWVGEKLHFTQSFPKTDLLWQDLAKGMYDTLGVDVYPEVYRFLVQNYIGPGAMELIRAGQILSGEKPDPFLKEVPFVQGFFNKSYSYDITTFFTNKRAVDRLMAKKNYAKENGELAQFNRKHPEVEMLKELFKEANKELRKLQAQRKAILSDRSDLRLRRERALQLDRDMRQIYQMTNKLYKEMTDPANKLGF
ncbi:LPD38 domain-containing protein [Taylorella equigenitalis]|uniref:LPD38 domain-containing protein n=1 Tax=Taylorella equigenitalis TaxID=29575 RepID=UPI0006C0FA3A|nr:LPD38 domain-containing protein [Taylorella equigenitalis]ASY30178.1 hypothetical protein B9Z30_02070 [Taylorella equigenitalis]KOS58495.1 hypothetical protein AM589_06385 [Taylorella equigenitalis]